MLLCVVALIGLASGPTSAQPAEPVRAFSDYVGAWVAQDFHATLHITNDPATKRGALSYEKMLFVVERVPGGENLFRCYFFEWTEDNSEILGPTYGIGAYNPVTGTLAQAGPSQGLNPIRLLPDGTLQYVHAKSLPGNSWVSVRSLRRVDAETAQSLEAMLRAKQAELAAGK